MNNLRNPSIPFLTLGNTLFPPHLHIHQMTQFTSILILLPNLYTLIRLARNQPRTGQIEFRRKYPIGNPKSSWYRRLQH